MKHQVFGRKLGRDIKERTALFRSLINALIQHGKIVTTVAKAKAVRPQIEKLVTHAKTGSVSSVRQITSYLDNPKNVRRLVEEIAPQFTSAGGYVRIYRLGNRMGDNAQQVILQWVTQPLEKPAPVAKTKAIAKPVVKEEEKKAEPKAKAPAKKRAVTKKK